MSKTAKKELTPPDETQCQSLRPNGYNFMSFGGVPGHVRCRNLPIVVVTERETSHEDGQKGSMSLCPLCFNKFVEQKGQDYATVRAIERPDEDKGV